MITKIQIRDTRNGDWFWVNRAVNSCPHINPYDKVVYGALCTFSGCKMIRPSFNMIAKRASVSIRSTKKSIKKLISVGYIKIKIGGGRGICNRYLILKAYKGCKLCTLYSKNKGCKLRPERVQATTIKGAQLAPEEEKELEKELDNYSELKKNRSQKKEKSFYSLKRKKPNTPQDDVEIKSQLQQDSLNCIATRNEINSLFAVFESSINPQINYGNKTQRAALEWLIRKYGFEKTKQTIKYAVSVQSRQYAPVITTPYQLKDKLAQLLVFYNRNQKPKIAIIKTK